MNWFENLFKKIKAESHTMLRDEDKRKNLLFSCLDIGLGVVAGYMTIINIITSEYILGISTLSFGLLCVLNIILHKCFPKLEKFISVLFGIECLSVLTFFIVSGIPNGFSALWVCLVPTFSLLVYGRKNGSLFSLVTFLMLIFFLWTPGGHSLLQYNYTNEFTLRFPFYYIAIFITSYIVETIRVGTQKQLTEAETEYHYLYRHDALTGIYNRYGFYETLYDRKIDIDKNVAVLMLDIDDFKVINDTHGHVYGDKVLMAVSGVMTQTLCNHCVFCRWGGEEFIAFLNCEHDYIEIAEQLRKNIDENEFEIDDEKIHITVSIGLCIVKNTDKFQVSELVEIADKCMYIAKVDGKNCVKYDII